MPYDAAKLVSPRAIQSHVEGAEPPSFEPMSAERPLIATPATRKRTAADVNGGMSSSPSRITSHVLPQTRHMSAIDPLTTRAEGARAGALASMAPHDVAAPSQRVTRGPTVVRGLDPL